MILMYHSLDLSGSPVSVPPDAFRAHLRGLAARGVAAMGIADLLRTPETQDAVAITFDDALSSVWTVAAPLLDELGLTATVFVPTAHAGGDNRWRGSGDPGIPHVPVMTWDELGALQRRGWTIGAHTRTHAPLTRCTAAQIADELEGSALDIRRALGEQPQVFAYPYGLVNARVAAAASAVFEYSVTTEMRVLSAFEARASLPRVDAFYFRANDLLAAWGSRRQRAYLRLRGGFRSLKRSVPRA